MTDESELPTGIANTDDSMAYTELMEINARAEAFMVIDTGRRRKGIRGFEVPDLALIEQIAQFGRCDKVRMNPRLDNVMQLSP